MKNFQIILLIVFGLFAGLALAFFSGGIDLPQRAADSPTGGVTGSVTMWGTLPSSTLRSTIDYLNTTFGGSVTLRYIQKDPQTYEEELLNAFAFGGAPDILLLSNSLISLYEDKIVTVPYAAFSERAFSDSYIQAADVFKNETGILGFPVLADPLIMFYNKSHFDSKGISTPPVYWKDLSLLVPTFTEKNEVLEIKKSGLAFGETVNVRNFKEIISALNLQLGNPITQRDFNTAVYKSVFSNNSPISSKPAEEALKFYLEFSNPLKSNYSWNKSMPDSLQAFVAGDLSVYFGLASEIPLIQRMNPNLNFDVAIIPQVEGSPSFVTYANVYALAIPKTSQNFQAAYYVSGQISNTDIASPFSIASGLTPVRRDLLKPSSAYSKYIEVAYRAALQSKSWVIPNSKEVEKIFASMVESNISGLKNISKSITDASVELQTIMTR
ncbi:MAG: multiple sugar transport system substrate-binding protein [Patescibacteria group bacterium]|jgi:ABC-type glycerol-3-phosphate transport system substrate-binding protein|nr:multiple sugar transport system substrate-binding protein [Patescibacteria group bacterium]